MAAEQWVEMVQKAEKQCVIEDGKHNSFYEVTEGSSLRTQIYYISTAMFRITFSE
jgi:hypothetical protein